MTLKVLIRRCYVEMLFALKPSPVSRKHAVQLVLARLPPLKSMACQNMGRTFGLSPGAGLLLVSLSKRGSSVPDRQCKDKTRYCEGLDTHGGARNWTAVRAVNPSTSSAAWR